MKWTPKNKRNTPWRLLKTKGTPPETPLVTLGGEKNALGDKKNAPGDSWRRKKCLLETLGDEKNASQRLLETKDFLTPPGDEMDSWKQLINFNNRKSLFI
ncbi:unnamed protein product [Rhizophagus irregularis]|nr:unnamed protein product [Rhizophagus irregularis]